MGAWSQRSTPTGRAIMAVLNASSQVIILWMIWQRVSSTTNPSGNCRPFPLRRPTKESSHERDREPGVDPTQAEQRGSSSPSPDCRECGAERNRSNRAFLDLRCVWATAACGFVLQPLGKTDLCLREAQGTDA